MDSKNKILRIIDANLNRSREGIRVIEDTARLFLDDEKLSKELKNIRHSITVLAEPVFDEEIELKPFRDSDSDVGRKGVTDTEGERKDIKHILQVNFKRVEEALRVLEEYFKLVYPVAAEEYKNLRFQIYSIEKKMLENI